MPARETVLNTEKLCKSYFLGKEPLPVLFDVDLTVGRGDYAAIMGPSGSGKSTLLNILGCLDTPTSGEYYLKNVAVSRRSPAELAEIRNRDIGFIFQNFNLLPKMTVAANVELPLIYRNVPKKERRALVEEALKRLGLWERRHHHPNEISGGQKQRTAIARALVKSPSLILADEPTGNLDSATTHEILTILDELNEQGNTIMVITHEHEVAERARRIFTILDGRLSEKIR